MLRQGGRKETLNSATKPQLCIYLFVPLPYTQMKDTTGFNKSVGPKTDGGTTKQNPACRKEQHADRAGWDFPGGDAAAWGRAPWILLRQSADLGTRRSGQAPWSAITCISQPQLGQNSYMNFMVEPGLGSIIFRGACLFIPHETISGFLSQGSMQGSRLVLTVTPLTVLGS